MGTGIIDFAEGNSYHGNFSIERVQYAFCKSQGVKTEGLHVGAMPVPPRGTLSKSA